MRERERGGARAPERAHVGLFWWSRGEGVREHQNEPTRARSGVRDEGEGEGRCASTRTSHTQARSGVRDEGEGEGRCASTRTCPHGHFLVFETREGKREHQN